jgi:hypothetical protein
VAAAARRSSAKRARQALTCIAIPSFVVAASASPAWGTWSVTLQAASQGAAAAGPAPAAPADASASCVLLESEVTLTWDSVASATSYSIYDSTTSETSGYSLLESDVTTTSWTSGDLATGLYWFEVAAYIGSNWASAMSAPTDLMTIALVCVPT